MSFRASLRNCQGKLPRLSCIAHLHHTAVGAVRFQTTSEVPEGIPTGSLVGGHWEREMNPLLGYAQELDLGTAIGEGPDNLLDQPFG